MPYRRRLVRAASISGSLASPCPRSAPRCCCVPWWLEQPSSLRWPALRGRCAHAALSHALEAVQTCFVLELEFPRGLAASAEPRHAALPAAASVRGDAPLVVLVIRVGCGMGASCSPRSPFQLQDFSLAVLVREAVRGDCAGLCF